MKRSSGIILHISSLPSPYGIGNLGKEAYRFIDFLKEAKQSYWQILPISPTGYGDSPYQSVSTFAGNSYFIDPQWLIEQNYLTEKELSQFSWGDDPEQTDYEILFSERSKMLHLAFSRFLENQEYEAFLIKNKYWLDEYALFSALKAHFDNKPWNTWPSDIRFHRDSAVNQFETELSAEISYHKFVQFCFWTQWENLRRYAHQNGIRIIGDLPIYVPYDSVDVWSNPQNFQLTRTRRPRVVAGCPPDFFNLDGQFWGHPIYDWDKMEQDGYSWWLLRIGAAAKAFDMVRIDHFRGIESYWSIPASHKTARHGTWIKGPGMKLIDAINEAYPDTDFIAEDLGLLTDDVRNLVAKSGWPGMKVLEFAFDPSESSLYLPHKYEGDCVCYTGTHDNEPLKQWCETRTEEEDIYVRNYLNIAPFDDLSEAMLKIGASSKAPLFIAQMQDYLKLGAQSRMNQPGICTRQNWRWRMRPDACTNRLCSQIAKLTVENHRI